MHSRNLTANCPHFFLYTSSEGYLLFPEASHPVQHGLQQGDQFLTIPPAAATLPLVLHHVSSAHAVNMMHGEMVL